MKRLFYLLSSIILFYSTVVAGQASTASNLVISKADLAKAGLSIPPPVIGEPVGSVRLYPPRWVEATGETPAYGVVEGSVFPVDPNGWPINFRVLLPANWSRRAMQAGGGGFNGIISVREGKNPMINRGFAIYGSDSGHQAGMGGSASVLATGPAGAKPDDWTLNEEAIRNLGYMQMKKTHDAAMAIIERVYGERPLFNYWVGGSQGGREGLMVAQRYPADYNGIISNVPIVNFSTLMLAPELIRIQEKPHENWVTPAKINAIRAEFLRQCDNLDGISDGIINNYMASRAIFDVTDDVGPADPWAALRATGGKDPDPDDNSASAKLTDGQIRTLEFVYSPYKFPVPLANEVKSFGMWLPNIEPDGFKTINSIRFRGQEGAAPDAPVHTSLGVLGVTGFMMQNTSANPLDFSEGGKMNDRRKMLSEWLDATDPDLKDFYDNGGKIIITSGTQDFIASSGSQLDYYQSLLNKMGRKVLDKFARLYVVPQGGHGLSGKSYSMNGEGNSITVKNIPAPNPDDNMDLIISWVEKGKAPSKTLIVNTHGRISSKQEGKGFLLCSYPEYPEYVGGEPDDVSSYKSSLK